MINEIGSEFFFSMSSCKRKIQLPNVQDYTYTFSGRTSIELVLKNEKQIKKVMIPSYCCDSMIEPFRRQGIFVCFYDVNYYGGLQINMKIEKDIDAVLWCNYFGFRLKMPDLSDFKKNGGIIIEDITHSFYSKQKYDEQSDYLIASIRKWEPILCGGYCASVKKKLNFKPVNLPPKEYLERKKNAMISKKEYLKGRLSISKEEFLEDFSKCNKWLAENYFELSIDQESIDILNQIDYEGNIKKRKENAKELYRGLRKCTTVQFLFEESLMDCPLFLPIIVDAKKRDEIREFLKKNSIYCPIHWPRPNDKCMSNLYDMEISLICDQRYCVTDMERIIEIIKEYEKLKSN